MKNKDIAKIKTSEAVCAKTELSSVAIVIKTIPKSSKSLNKLPKVVNKETEKNFFLADRL